MIQHKLLRLNLQYFADDTGAAGDTATATAPGTTETAGAGDSNAATGGTDTSAAGDDTTGGGDKNTDSKLSVEDLKRYHESEFLKALGFDSIDAAKTALTASQQKEEAETAGSKDQAADDKQGDTKDGQTDDAKTDEKADKGAAGDADKQPPADESEKPAPTIEEKDAEIGTLKATLAAVKNGVKDDSLDDVLVLATALSKKGDGMEIDAAIKAVVEKYPSFAGVAEAAPDPDKPRFGTTGSERKADDRDPFVRSLLGK